MRITLQQNFPQHIITCITLYLVNNVEKEA